MAAEVSTHTFLAMIIEKSVCFMSCEPFFWVQLFLCGTDPGSYKFTIRTKRKRTKNANETNEKRTNASHERCKKRTIHEANGRYRKRTHDTRTNERTNEMKRTNYSENANERIHETNERYTKRTHDTRTNESLERSHILSNDKLSGFYIEVQYSIVLLFE